MSERWEEEELQGIDLGDERLNKRAKKLLNRLGEKPTASIPGACKGWGETQAAYRFLSHDEIGWEDLLSPHVGCTHARMYGHKTVLCIQDTTELDFNGRRIQGMGTLSYQAQRGMYLHPTYAVSTEREPLGVLDVWMWVRGKKTKSSRKLAAGEKESRRWIAGYERVAEYAAHLPDTRLVYVADREGDFIDLMVRAQELGTPADWLIRAAQNRNVVGEQPKLWEDFEAVPVLGEIRFTLPARKGQAARQVRQQLSVKRCRLQKQATVIEVTALVAQEINAPEGVKPITWRLLTNRNAATLDAVMELINWYLCRWEIEIFFDILKNGCQVEALQLSTIERVELTLALFLIVAWRIQMLMRLGRTCPEMDSEVVFDRQEWQAAYIVAQRRLSAKPPSLNTVIRLIAGFGGFLGRKGDGQPGAKALWIGLQRVSDFAAGIHAFQMAQNCV